MSKKDQREQRARAEKARRKADSEADHDRLIERLSRMTHGERIEYLRHYSGDDYGLLLHEAGAQAELDSYLRASEQRRDLNRQREEGRQQLEREWREKQDRAPQIDDSDPEANLEDIMRRAQEFDASYVPPCYDETPPATDDAPPSDTILPRHSHEPELEAYGSQALDPKRFEKMAAQHRAIEQAKREAWTNSFAVKQEAERAAREARTVARRAEQDAKRGVMKQARQDAARALARALERATAANAATLRELVRYPED